MLLEIVTVVTGFILPRLFIGTFGSEVNGLVSSISSFIGYISLLQSGVGSVAKAAMYKPLAKCEQENLCIIVRTVEAFFRKIAVISVIYILVLCILFPSVIAPDSGTFIYTGSLVLIIGVSTAAQYFFGITYQMLLEADQRSYVYSIIQISAVIINTIISVILIRLGCSVQMVKLGSAAVFVLRPVVLSIYARRKYRIDKNVSTDNSLIKQRWDGFAQAIAYFIHSKTDIFVLTVFARITVGVSLSLVSVYSVYHMVTTGLTSFIRAIEKSVTSALGNIIALGERENLIKTFNAYNNFMHIICTAVFATASITVFKFIGVYVKNITDVEYVQHAFGYIIVTAEYLYCIRSPYNSIIYAAGKFKETRASAAIEAILNIFTSLILVSKYGLIGVAIGTFVAMAYRTVSFIRFVSKEVINLGVGVQVRRYVISFVIYAGLIYSFTFVNVSVSNYFSWVLYSGVSFVVCISITLTVNYLLLRKETLAVVRTFLKRSKKIAKTAEE